MIKDSMKRSMGYQVFSEGIHWWDQGFHEGVDGESTKVWIVLNGLRTLF